MRDAQQSKTGRTLNSEDIARINSEMLYEMPVYPTQAVILFGSDVMSYYVAQETVNRIRRQWRFIPEIYICGGQAATENFSLRSLVPEGKHPHEGEKEAEYMKRLLIEAGLPEGMIRTDTHSTNTQENIEHALALGADKARSISLFCPPYLQKRALMTWRKLAPNAAQGVGTVACYPEGSGLTKDNWPSVPYIAFKMHEEAWKAGVLDHVPKDFEDGDPRNYLERGFIVPVNIHHEAAHLRAVAGKDVPIRLSKG